MGKSKRRPYHVRIRHNGTKKTLEYMASSSGDAASKYNGPGSVMYVTKISRGKLVEKVGANLNVNSLLRECQEMDKEMRRKGVFDKIKRQISEVGSFINLGPEIMKEIRDQKGV
jgi:hypothetical protein